MNLHLKGESSVGDIKRIYLGTTEVDKLLSGTDLVYERKEPDTTPPITTVFPDPTISHDAGTEFWLEVNEACTTYFTLDGSTPTTTSTIFTESFTLDVDTTIKYFSVDLAGNTEAVKTTAIDIIEPVASGWRYLKIEGYGSVEETATTRLIEFEAWESGINRMTGATILSHDPINTGGGIGEINNGSKATTGYPIWWLATPNANVVVDLGAVVPLTKLNYYSYSVSGVQRANRFNILASNTNNGTDWVNIWNMSANTTPQPILPSGYELIL